MKKLFLPLLLVVCLAGDTSTRAVVATISPATIASQLGNISTRGFVQTGDNVMIGGFIIEGPTLTPKTVIVRAIGPALIPPPYNISNALADPTVDLYDGTGTRIASNDNWQHTIIGGIITSDQVSAIQNSGHVPSQPSESAIIATLQPGNYTAIVRGVNNITGVALVEVYDLGPTTASILGNISTRGFVQTGDNVMIGGFIVHGTGQKKVVVRAIGPALIPPPYNISNALADPTVDLYDGTGTRIASNDNWQHTIIGGIITSDQVSAIQNSGHAPSQPSESAIIADLSSGAYTAIVRGVNNTTGVALVEVYDLTPVSLIGAFNFPGPYPPITEVTYSDKSGQTLSTLAYSGQVTIFVKPTELDAAAATQLIRTNQGTVIAQIPTAGIYWAEMLPGSESNFITAMYTEPSVIYALPNIPLTGSTNGPPVDLSGATSTTPLIPMSGNLIAQFDYFGLPGNEVCGLSHGFAVNAIAEQNNQVAGIYDITQGGQVVLGPPSDPVFGVFRAAEGGRIVGQKLIVNASLQSRNAPNDGIDRSICENPNPCPSPTPCPCSCQGNPPFPNPPCRIAPNSNYQAWKAAALGFLLTLAQSANNLRADLLDNTMLVVSAGNGGLDLTHEISLIRQQFPRAFSHMLIVGALDSQGVPYPGFNHASDPSHMLYAPGVNVVIPGTGGCLASGTSFAAPAVASLVSRLARAFPTLTTGQLKTAIERAAPIVSGGRRAIPTFEAAANEARQLLPPPPTPTATPTSTPTPTPTPIPGSANYTGNFTGSVIDNCSFQGLCVLRDTVTSSLTLSVSGSGTPSDPYSGTGVFNGTLVITVISGGCHGDTIPGSGTGVVSGSAGRVLGHVEFDVRGSHVTVDFTNGVISGNQLTGNVSINLGFCVPPITGQVTLTRE